MESDDILMTSTYDFIKFKSKSLLNTYSKCVRQAMRTPHPYYHISTNIKKDGSKEKRMIFAVKHGRAEGVQHTSNLFDICDSCVKNRVDVPRAFLNTFSNGVTCYTYYTNDDVSDK